ncbi:hypothetical protein ACFVWT_01305 [Arthrobacter sp. NPDC058288]|uniref:hypothetical protein n=1 Tax=Arthrobacter sp. NPDC058288 TaxID=3346424 RepID=UPI0036E0C2B8
MSELAYRTKQRAGVNRRTPVWGGTRPLAAPVTPVSAGWTQTTTTPPAPTPTTAPATEASAVLHSGIRALPSTSHRHGTAHLRPAVKVPVRLSLAGLGSVSGSVSVQVTISPATPVAPATGDVSVSFSYVDVGAVSLSPTLKRAGNTFTAAFACAVAAGLENLDFDFCGHSYRGRNSDRGDFSVATEVTFQEHGQQAPTVLSSGALIRL